MQTKKTAQDYLSFYQRHVKGLKQQNGDEWEGQCPFGENHSDGQDSNPSFCVNVKSGMYHCQACKASGNYITFCKKKGIPLARGNAGNNKQPEAIFQYRDQNKALLYEAVRYPGKDFKQRRPDEKGGWIWKVKGLSKVPYRLPELLQSNIDDWVFIPEGEKHVDRLYKLGLIAACNVGGAEKWTKELNPYFKGRRVCILPDKDAPGNRHGQKVAYTLHPFAKEIRILELPELPHKGDIINWLDAGHKKEELFKLVGQTKPWILKAPKDEEKQRENNYLTQSQLLVIMADEADLFHTPDEQIFATISIDNHKENWPVKGDAFKRWLKRKFYKKEGKPPGSQAFQDALGVLEARGQYDASQKSVFTRLAEADGTIYLDLINENWEVIEISSSGWKIIDNPPVKFRRTKGMLSLPSPIKGRALNDLRAFVNIPNDNDWNLFISWLVGSLRSKGPYPILVLQGEQGSAKSFTSRLARSIIDPSTALLRTTPREERDLMIAAYNSWIIAFDNISSLKDWLSDALCRISTGGGLSIRQNYTDDQEILFDVMRPILLNGIDSIVTRHDLADRAIIINLPPIPEEKRKTRK